MSLPVEVSSDSDSDQRVAWAAPQVFAVEQLSIKWCSTVLLKIDSTMQTGSCSTPPGFGRLNQGGKPTDR